MRSSSSLSDMFLVKGHVSRGPRDSLFVSWVLGTNTFCCDSCFVVNILFHPQSAFYPWSAVCSLHFTPGLQSAVCILPSVCILPPVCSLQSAFFGAIAGVLRVVVLLKPKTVWESLSAEWQNLCHVEFSIHDAFEDQQPRRNPFRSWLSLDALVGPLLSIVPIYDGKLSCCYFPS